jgi:hypothetical protein
VILTAKTKHDGFDVVYIIPERYYNWNPPRLAESTKAGYYWFRHDGLPESCNGGPCASREEAIAGGTEDVLDDWGDDA